MKLYKVVTYPLEGRVTTYYYGASDIGGKARFVLSTVTEGIRTVLIAGPAVKDESEDEAAAIHTYLQLPLMQPIALEEVPRDVRKLVKDADIARISHWERADVTHGYFSSLRMEALALHEAKNPPRNPRLMEYLPIALLAVIAGTIIAAKYGYI